MANTIAWCMQGAGRSWSFTRNASKQRIINQKGKDMENKDDIKKKPEEDKQQPSQGIAKRQTCPQDMRLCGHVS